MCFIKLGCFAKFSDLLLLSIVIDHYSFIKLFILYVLLGLLFVILLLKLNQFFYLSLAIFFNDRLIKIYNITDLIRFR